MAGLRHQRAGDRDAGRARSRRAGSRPAVRSPSRSTSPPPSSAAAASYKLALEDKELDSDGMIELLTGWIGRYPIVSIEDPLAEDDDGGFAAFTREVGGRVQVIGDDFLVTQASRVREAALRGAAQRGAAEAEPARHADRDVRGAGRPRGRRALPASSRPAPARPRTSTIVHLAVGWGAGQLKVGQLRARRAHGEVERGAAHRGSARRQGAVRWWGGVSSTPAFGRPPWMKLSALPDFGHSIGAVGTKVGPSLVRQSPRVSWTRRPGRPPLARGSSDAPRARSLDVFFDQVTTPAASVLEEKDGRHSSTCSRPRCAQGDDRRLRAYHGGRQGRAASAARSTPRRRDFRTCWPG